MSDALSKYRAKRRFDQTEEPAGEPPAKRGAKRPRFSIQEHSATRWHFDLRLERDGVLVSFALPRGLPDDPASNRKAVHTEDHPLEYLTWEGTIPKGSYGAGTMSVYDRGTYEVEKWESKKIVVTLTGKRVQGTYALFQTGGDGKDWMIHRMDNPEVTGDPPLEHVVPMMATLSQLPSDEDAYTFEVKWDGMRAIAYSEPGRLRLETRTLREITSGFPELGRLQRQLGARRAVLDGEIVALDDDGRPSFQRLQARIHLTAGSEITRAARAQPVVYMIFDLLYLDGESLLDADHATRRRRLEELQLEGDAWRCRRSWTAPLRMCSPPAAQRAWRASSPSAATRRTSRAIAAASGSRSRTCCGRSSWSADTPPAADGGPTRSARCWWATTATASCTTRARWAPATPTPTWRCSPNGCGRWPANALRSRRNAAQGRGVRQARAGVRVLVRRVDAPGPPAPAELRGPARRQAGCRCRSGRGVGVTRLAALVKAGEPRAKGRVAVEIDGRELVLSNLDKVLYPKAGFTKGEVIDYYLRVAPTMLTHLGGRPVTRKRYPNGVDEAFFFEKNAPAHRPEWVRDGHDSRQGQAGLLRRLLGYRDARVAGESGGARAAH